LAFELPLARKESDEHCISEGIEQNLGQRERIWNPAPEFRSLQAQSFERQAQKNNLKQSLMTKEIEVK